MALPLSLTYDKKTLVFGCGAVILFYTCLIVFLGIRAPTSHSDHGNISTASITVPIHGHGVNVQQHDQRKTIPKEERKPFDITAIKILVQDFGLSETLSLKALDTLANELDHTAIIINPYATSQSAVEKALQTSAGALLSVPLQSIAKDNDVGALGLSPYYTPDKNYKHFISLIDSVPNVAGIAMNIAPDQERRILPAMRKIMPWLGQNNMVYIDLNNEAPQSMKSLAQEYNVPYIKYQGGRYRIVSVYNL